MPETKEVKEKVEILKRRLKTCLDLSKSFRKRYQKIKKWDDRIDFFNAISSGTAIILIVVGFANPPCLLASAVVSGVEFIVSRGQDKWNLKAQYTQHHTTHHQYNDLAREIQAVMSKNNMTSEEYQNYIEEINGKMSLIEDSQLI